jgi:putative ABC transport system permease protein
MFDFDLIFRSLKRNTLGATLIALQIGVTVAIMANAIAVIRERYSDQQQSTGVEEAELFQISVNHRVDPTTTAARFRANQEALRALPSVAAVAQSNSLPMTQSGWSSGIRLTAERESESARTAVYLGGRDVQAAFGLKIIAGKNFSQSQEVLDTQLPRPAEALITEALALALFDERAPIGKVFYESSEPTRVVGVIENLRTPWHGWSDGWRYNAFISSEVRMGDFQRFQVRAKPGQLRVAMAAAEQALRAANSEQVVDEPISFATTRANFFKSQAATMRTMIVLQACLVLVTIAGLVGLVSFWVQSRRRQIGIQRALGATQATVLRFFMQENLLIIGIGALLGFGLALLLNLWLMKHMGMQQLPLGYPLLGALLTIAIGQMAVFVPAKRGSQIPPVAAIRG